MYELIENLISVDKNREVKIYQIDMIYFVAFFQMRGPNGDQGYSLPDINVMPEEMYNSAKMAYDLQFESKMLPFGMPKKCVSLEEAQKEAQYFIENL
jgi:hypothetical protein